MMSATLLIRFDADASGEWLALPEGTRGTGTPPQRLAAAGERQIVVLVPTEDVLLSAADLPAVGAAKLARVLPFALEDQVLAPVESLHFALGPELGDGRRAVAVVANERMAHWQGMLAEAGLVADRMLPDVLALPWSGGAANLLVESERALCRTGAAAGFAAEAGQLMEWFAGASMPTQIHVHSIAPAPAIGWPDEVSVSNHMAPSALSLLAAGLADAPDWNLLQGSFAPRHRRAPQRRLWRIAAVLALVAVGLGLLSRGIDWWRLDHAAGTLQSAIAAEYAKAFPASPPVPNPVARTRSELQRLGADTGGSGFLVLLGKVAPVLASHDSRMVTLGVEYRSGVLELSVRAVDVAGLDALRERLATLPDLKVELVAATPDADGVGGQLRIEAVPS